MKEVDVKPDETLQMFATRWGITVDVVIQSNPDAADRLQAIRIRPPKLAKLSIFDKLNVPDDAVEVGAAQPQQAQQVQVQQLPPLVYTNTDFEWLSYEAVVNNPQFRRTNQKLEFSLYAVPVTDVEIWLREGLDNELLTILADAFFPDIRGDGPGVTAISKARWPWKNEQFQSSAWEARRAKQPGSRNRNTLKLPPRTILPYNPCDNHKNSLAMGTDRPSTTARQLKENLVWSFWKTASRSCVALLERRKEKAALWGDVLKPGGATTPWEWPWAKGVDQRKIAADRVEYKAEIEKKTRLTAEKMTPKHVSLKTGVCYVGAEDQSWKTIKADGKDAIDSNWVVSCLRSDYVVETNALLAEKGQNISPSDSPLVVLTELLTVVESTPRDNPISESQFQDGVQVRDLSLLKKKRVYVFPGSIPFVGADYKALAPQPYSLRNNADWKDFWRENWAAALGRAKALFALRYGLQHVNPNPQNYLIELRKGEPDGLTGPSRIVIRDLQDASLHREVMWALYGDPNALPETVSAGRAGLPELVEAFKTRAGRANGAERTLLRMLQYEFESVDGCQETGTTDIKFGKPGTRLAWWLFSTGKGMNDAGGSSRDALKTEIGEQGLNEVMAMLSEWGMAHDAAYLHCVERELGAEIRTIDWTKFPTKLRATEEEAADLIHAYLASTEGQTALRAYRNRGWTSAKATATLEFVDAADRPLPWRTILFENEDGSIKWSQPTDAQGKILRFAANPVASVARLHNPGAGPMNLTAVSATKWKVP